MDDNSVQPLGQPSLDRYRSGSWEAALLARMAYWVRRMHTGGMILDVGCGEGALLNAANRGGVGIDLNPQRLVHAGHHGMPVCLADGARLPFADHRFDVAVSMEVLEHVKQMEPVIKEVHRVLRQGGHWILSVPSVTLRSWYEMWREQRPYYCDENEHFREFSPVNIPWFKNRFMSIRQLDSMLEDYHFGIVRRDGVRYVFPQWFGRWPALRNVLESGLSDRAWAHVPVVRQFPFWVVRVVRVQS